MKTLAGATPSPPELQSLMEKMDSNKDGRITVDEFVNALSEWLKEEETGQKVSTVASPSPRKRKANQTSETRTRIHKRISSFFLQFHRSSDFDRLRQKYLQNSDCNSGHESHDEKGCPAQLKLQRLDASKNSLKNLPEIAIRCRINDPAICLACMTELADMLSVVEVFQTPEERYEIGEYLVELFRAITDSSVISRAIEFLAANSPHALQFQAARVISYYGPGLRIAHTPPDSLLHPDKLFHKTVVIRAGAGHALVPLLTSPCLEVREQAVVAIGKLASYDAEVRDFFLQLGCYPILCAQIQADTRLELLEKITFTMSIFCGRTQKGTHPAPYNVIAAGLPRLCWLFYRDDVDERTMVNVCLAVRELLVGITLDDSLCLRLVYLLERCQWLRVQEITLSIVTHVVRCDANCTLKLLNFGLLPALAKLMESTNSAPIRAQAVELAGCLIHDRKCGKAVIDAGIVAELVRLLNTDEAIERNILKVLGALVSPEHITALVEDLSIVKVLSDRLVNFKQYDSVLRETYNYLGATYDFGLVHDVITMLGNVLRAIGESKARSHLLQHFDLECVEKIRQVMLVCASKGAHEMDAWRASSGVNLEHELQAIMEAIRNAHQTTSSSLSVHMTKAVQQHLEEFKTEMAKNAVELEHHRSNKGHHPAKMQKRGNGMERYHKDVDMESNQKINIKCVLLDDIRILENVPRNVTLKSLQTLIAIKYGRQHTIQYPDKDGDMISIDSDGLLRDALTAMENSAPPSFKFQLKPVEPVVAERKEPVLASVGTQSDLASLVKQTNFTAAQLSRLYTQFRKHAVNNALPRAQFAESLKEVGVTDDPDKIEQFFVAFDGNHNGAIDFREFASNLSVLLGGSMNERLELAFHAYDKDGNGRIDKHELEDLYRRSLGTVLAEKGLDKAALDELIASMVNKCFSASDLDGDGTLSLEEFKQAAFRQQIVVESFWKNPI